VQAKIKVMQLLIRSNTFGVFSYKFALLTRPGYFKVTVYKKNQMGHKIMAYKEQLTNLVYQKS
jgi:hypothetical protein